MTVTQQAKINRKCSRYEYNECGFTGRWMFLRALLPYLYRQLRQNGGLVDRVLFSMLGYTSETQHKLQHFSTAANTILQYEVFQFLF